MGTPAEHSLLGAVIMDQYQIEHVTDRVNGNDFSNPSQGKVFDAIVNMHSMGEHIDQITVSNKIVAEGIRVQPADVFEWVDPTMVYPYAATEYADAVRSDAIRRGITEAAQMSRDMLGRGNAPTTVASDIARMLNALVDGSVSGRMVPKSLAEILDVEDTYDWVIEGLLERHDRLVITGPEGGGKSMLSRQLAILPAAGIHPMKFTPIDPISVLVVDAENTERQWRRAATWMANRAREHGARDPRGFVNIVAGRRIDITSGADLGQIHRMIDRFNPDLIYIGPLYKLVPHAINTDDDAAPLITALDSLREREVALLMEAHAGHATTFGGERNMRPRGSSALLGWPEFGMGLSPTMNELGEPDNRVMELVKWRGDREERDWPKAIIRGYSWPWEPHE